MAGRSSADSECLCDASGLSRLGRSVTPFRDDAFPGRLFIVEGIDGSGKSTQLDLLYKWLVGQGYLVVSSEWNSSRIVKGTTKRGKGRRLLSPMSFSLIHAADFANRIHAQILPALHAQMLDEFGLVRMDATEPLVIQQERLREIVTPHLDGVKRADAAGIHEALREAGLQGRYLDEAARRRDVQA